MIAVPIATLLVDFQDETGGGKPPRPRPTSHATAAVESKRADAAIAEAYQRGHSDGKARMLAEWTEQQRALARSDAEDRAREIQQLASALSAQFQSGLEHIAITLGDTLADLLRPLLARSIEAAALEALRAAVQDCLAGGSGLTVHVSGPEHLLSPLRSALVDARQNFKFKITAGPDVRIVIDQLLLETRLEAWSQTIEIAR